jgi:hypothetical protein
MGNHLSVEEIRKDTIDKRDRQINKLIPIFEGIL